MSASPITPRPARQGALRRRAARSTAALGASALLVLAGTAAHAATGGQVLAADDIPTVINNLRDWLMGILTILATLFLTLGGVRYVLADGDPGQIEKAKGAFRSAAIGYCLAVLAPIVVTVLSSIVGG